jgi:FMN phosphatase YigB (HAD superfamily)
MSLTLLIDLDDTLLPNSTEKFLPNYLDTLSRYLDDLAPPQKVIETLYWATMKALDEPSIDTTIAQRFNLNFYSALGTTFEAEQERVSAFYTEIFPGLSPIPEPDPDAVELIETALRSGYQVAIATQPIYPAAATLERMRWAGLAPEDHPFEIISTFENFHFGKPHPAFFLELIAQIGWPETGFVMLGDSQEMDIEPAKALGMATYWFNGNAAPTGPTSRHGKGKIGDFFSWLDAQDPEDLALPSDRKTLSLEALRANPAALQTILAQAPDSIWQPSPDMEHWYATEILCHLRDVDREVHLMRLKTIQQEDKPFLPAINADPWAVERNYRRQDGKQALEEYIQARKELLALAEELLNSDLKKEIRHTIFGPITLEEILRIAARHDSLHVQQLYSLLPGRH